MKAFRFMRAIELVRRQAEQVSKGGIMVLLRKVWILSLTALGLAVTAAVRLLSPVIVIRLGRLRNLRIGHFVINTELYLCERELGLQGKGRTFDLFYYYRGYVCNKQLEEMWKRKLHIFPQGYILEVIDKVNHWFPGYLKHTIELPSDRDTRNLLGRTKTHLIFTPEEERAGEESLRRLGIPEGAKFVCIHSRDRAYLTTVTPDNNWNYSNYRDCSIKNYISSAEKLTGLGYYVIRMGSVVGENLDTENPMIINYPKIGRNDLLDIYLCAKCEFFLGATTGLSSVPCVFRKPVAWTNAIPLDYVPSFLNGVLFIPKKLWLRQEGRFMTFREILSSYTGRFAYTKEYEQANIDVTENTPEEITDLVVETEERLTGRWQESKEDEGLQQRFWSLFRPSDLHGKISAKIGTEFLRKNGDLLK